MIQEDIQHWQNLQPPLCPNSYEIEIYSHHTKGLKPICLLGMTKELQFICDYMIDLHPIKQNKPVYKKDWKEFNDNAEAIIGDGVLNLEGLELVNLLYSKCKKLIFRVFTKKFDWMKYACYFPKEFPKANLVIPTQKDIVMVVYENFNS